MKGGKVEDEAMGFTDSEFRIAVTEIQTRYMEANKAWVLLQNDLDMGAAPRDQAERRRQIGMAHHLSETLRYEAFNIVWALTATPPLPEWQRHVLERVPGLVRAAGERARLRGKKA